MGFMRFAFEVSKLLFLLVVLSIAILQYTGSQIVDSEQQEIYIHLLLPAFFLLGGLMLGRIVSLFFAQTFDLSENEMVKGFVIGLVLGIVAVLLYFFGGGGIV